MRHAYCEGCVFRKVCDERSCQMRFKVDPLAGMTYTTEVPKEKMKLDFGELGLEKNEKGEYKAKSAQKALKAEDLGKVGKILDAAILKVDVVRFESEDQPKVMLELNIPDLGKEEEKRLRRLGLNKTNLVTLSNAFGDESERWINKMIELRVERTQYQGQMVPAIRVYPKD